MKKIFALGLCAFLACSFVAISGASAPPFEGVLNLEMSANGQKIPMVETIKGGNIRTDMSMGMMTMSNIIDVAGKKMTMLMPMMKMYRTMDMPSQKSMNANSMPKPMKTGKSETILSYTCDEWTWTDPGSKRVTSMWLAKGLGIPATSNGGQMDRFMGQAASAFALMIKEGELYPLRTITKDASGQETFRMEVTKIELKPVDASLFQIPAGYKQMPANMGGMMGHPMNDR